MSIRVCLLSDTHGHVDPRIVDIAAGCDHVVHAGDIGGPGVLESLRRASPSVIAVRGNNDTPAGWPGAARRMLAELPPHAVLELPGGLLVAEHGHRVNPVAKRHARLRARHADARAIVYGHSHRLAVDRDLRPWVLNPGAAGRSRTFGGPSCLVLSASERRWSVAIRRFPAN